VSLQANSISSSILDAIHPGLELVILSMVLFATGEVVPDLDLIIAKCHSVGALVLLDAYHCAGVIPINMTELDADFMIGGAYKYLRGGPGACWLAVHPRHRGQLRTLDTGWFAKKNPFGYERSDEPILSESGDAWLESTPPVLTYYQARSGLAFTLSIGVERLRTYNLEQQKILRDAFNRFGVRCIEPAHSELRGAFTLVPCEDAQSMVAKLKTSGVNTDARGGCVRFGPDLLNSESEHIEAARITSDILNQD
jgi:kynureninase